MEGHELLGFAFFVIGLWHLFNHVKLHHALCSNSYKSTLWFPTSKFRYLELYFIMVSSTTFMLVELFISPIHHQPFDPIDGSIPSIHLHNFEHSSMALSFVVYATFTILLDKTKCIKTQHELTHLLGSIAFSQFLLLIHFHSTDHKGLEGQYHLLLQVLIFISLVTTLMGIGLPKSFMVCFVRSVAILFQGMWLMMMGFILWTPGYAPKGCFMELVEEGQNLVKCNDDEALHRAISVVNLQFSWLLIGVTVFAMCFYLVMGRWYGGDKVEYVSLRKDEQHYHQDVDDASNNDVESQSQKNSMQQKIGSTW